MPRARIPIHPATTHLPIALWLAVPCLDAAFLVLRTDLWALLALWCGALGCAAALPALATGMAEFLRIDERTAAERQALKHMTFMSIAWVSFGTGWLLRVTMAPAQVAHPGFFLIGSALCVAVLAVGAHAGGELTYRHGVGVSGERAGPTPRRNGAADPPEDT